MRQTVPIQFWVMMNNHFQDVQDRFPEKMAWARKHYRVENLTYRKLLSYFGAVQVPQCCRLSFPRSQVSWEDDGILYIDIGNHNYKALFPDVAKFMNFNAGTTGDLLEVTEKSHPDIFHALPMSYGTLGFVVGVTLKVVPYRPYIRIEYFPTRTLEETTSLLKQLTR